MNVRDEFLPAAQELLDLFGLPATITRAGIAATPTSAQKFDKAARTASPVVTISTIAVIVDPVAVENDDGKRVSKSTVVMLDQPIEGDILHIGDDSYCIGVVNKTAPQGQAIYYEAEVS
jgi:hypothetical protein